MGCYAGVDRLKISALRKKAPSDDSHPTHGQLSTRGKFFVELGLAKIGKSRRSGLPSIPQALTANPAL
ncbi:hypothetical protein CIHG_00039 [Coccidioides immitis H538.4]|uniref:Uncharacterized protein n=1 Tax=Coccidioides immitis H538.4 TaxID=396776 RepID=A0A0J8U5H7_COCIT|nr:hypothetical protein CIHG_00039 [Coccidioides immitis H538.4]